MTELNGLSILITREENQAKAFSSKIREYGGFPVEIPMIHFVSPKDLSRIKQAIKMIDDYDWIVFTSKNGVDFFFSFLQHYHVDKTIIERKKIAVVGKKTAAVLKKYGDFTPFIPQKFVAEGLIDDLKRMMDGSEKFLLARGNLARSVLPDELEKMGQHVTDLVVYHTEINDSRKDELITLLENKKIDVITFSSPSTVEFFMTLLQGTNFRQWLAECIIACIGPITKKRAIENQIPVHICPKEYTIDGMIESLLLYTKNIAKDSSRLNGL